MVPETPEVNGPVVAFIPAAFENVFAPVHVLVPESEAPAAGVAQVGTPPATVNTWPAVPIPRAESVFGADA